MSKIDELFGERIKLNTENFSKVEDEFSEQSLEIKQIDKILTIGLALIILIVPLIVRVKFIDFISPMITGSNYDSGLKGEIFTYNKFVVLITATIILLIIFLYKLLLVGYTIPKSKLNIYLGLFLILITLSTMLSSNNSIALFGVYDRHGGLITYLCYFTLFFIAANIEYTSKLLNLIIYSLVPFVSINMILGLLNLYGIDVFQWNWVNNMVAGHLQEGQSLGEGSRLWSTLNNPNYISGFAGTLTSLFFALAILKEKTFEKVILLTLSFASVTIILTSISTSGFLSLIFTLPIILLFYFKSNSKKKFLTFYLIGLLGFGLILNFLAIKEPKVWNESIGFFINKNPYIETENTNSKPDSNVDIKVSKVEGKYKLIELPKPSLSGGSGRIYIWGKSIEMIGQKPFLGYGLDTFVYHFPQDDVGKISGLGMSDIIVDKPHNMYLEIALGSGILAIILFLIIIVLILIKWISNILKEEADPMLIALGIGIIAYFIQAMFNDSIIGITNTIFILLGVLVSIVYKRKSKVNN